ncbi:response regulator transcription factor [Terracidiphilus gabretensis]|uniref:response regulator transcription factor n=1 Tax=Terracidiphilus gabretensis TaxID=1577687 RepID=UPI0018D241A6
MPGIGGIKTCRRIRRVSAKQQILMPTVRDDEDDKVEALEASADDYVTKPFQFRELTARIRTAIRRFRAPEIPAEMAIFIGSIELDPVRRRVERNGSEVHLTAREFNALQLLMTHAADRLPMRDCFMRCVAGVCQRSCVCARSHRPAAQEDRR